MHNTFKNWVKEIPKTPLIGNLYPFLLAKYFFLKKINFKVFKYEII
jgi:hypothetical protein